MSLIYKAGYSSHFTGNLSIYLTTPFLPRIWPHLIKLEIDFLLIERFQTFTSFVLIFNPLSGTGVPTSCNRSWICISDEQKILEIEGENSKFN